MSDFAKGFITGLVGSIILLPLIKTILGLVGVWLCLFAVFILTGINLMSFANVILVYIIWILYRRFKKHEHERFQNLYK